MHFRESVLCSSVVLVHSMSGDCPFLVPQEQGQNIDGVIKKVATNVSNESVKILTMPAAATLLVAGTVVTLMQW